MNNLINRPQWLKILIGILMALTSFLISIAIFFIIVWAIQIRLLKIEIVGMQAFGILIVELIIAIFFSYRFTKWLNRCLDKKSLKTNYIVLIVLILLSILFVPLLLTYMIY